jgi:hypothetical protein
MRQRSDREEKERVTNERAMANIETAAKRQYEADKKAEEEHRQAQLGKWVSIWRRIKEKFSVKSLRMYALQWSFFALTLTFLL